jgi:hypothetical protein
MMSSAGFRIQAMVRERSPRVTTHRQTRRALLRRRCRAFAGFEWLRAFCVSIWHQLATPCSSLSVRSGVQPQRLSCTSCESTAIISASCAQVYGQSFLWQEPSSMARSLAPRTGCEPKTTSPARAVDAPRSWAPGCGWAGSLSPLVHHKISANHA